MLTGMEVGSTFFPLLSNRGERCWLPFGPELFVSDGCWSSYLDAKGGDRGELYSFHQCTRTP